MTSIYKLLILSVSLFYFSSCSEKKQGEQKPTLLSNFIKISDSEDKGVKSVLAAYGGYCSYSVGASVDSRGENEKYFELKLSKSEEINNNKEYCDLIGPGICYTFFNELVKEKNSYSSIRSQIELNDGKEKSYEFSINDLKKVQQKIYLVENMFQILKDKQFQKLILFLDNQTVVKYNMDDLIKTIIKTDEVYGSVQSFTFLGFSIDKNENNLTLLKVAGKLNRKIQNHPIKIVMDLNSNSNKVLFLDFTLD